LAGGVDIAIVSKRLGHCAYTITADTYCHLLPGVGQHAAEAAANMGRAADGQPLPSNSLVGRPNDHRPRHGLGRFRR
jgi:hypothetical protein